MKKNLAFILALVMLLGTIFSVVPMAEASSETPPAEAPAEKYTPEVAYSNLNYTDKMYMMFAVPAPASLDEGASVKLILWESREESIAFSYNDVAKIVLEAEAETVKIGEVDHLVFKYDGLSANQMANIICVRPAVVKNDVATAYGKLVEYSVLEYVAAARGEFEGIEGLKDQTALGLLDTLLDFGALAQKYLSADEPEYYANDDLHKIYVTPVLNGIKKDKVFTGFFKYEEGGISAIYLPFYDGTEVVSVKDADGNDVADLDENIDGFQFEVKDADLTITVEYQNVSVRAFYADDLGADFAVNNHTEANVTKFYFPDSEAWTNMSGKACQLDPSRMNYWHGFKTVTDPEDPEGLVLQVTATNAPTFQFNNTTAAIWAGYGFGDTVYPAFTFELDLGAVDGKMPSTGRYYFRHRPGSQYAKYGIDLNIFSIVDGVVTLPNGTEVGKIPETGMAKFAITVDALTNVVYGYRENENGEIELTATSEMVLSEAFLSMQQLHFDNLADEDPSNDRQFLTYESIFTFFTTSNLEPTWVVGAGPGVNPEFEASSIEINGVMTPVKNEDGSFNMEAVQAVAERDYSFLLDNFKLTIGAIYEQ